MKRFPITAGLLVSAVNKGDSTFYRKSCDAALRGITLWYLY